MLALDITLILGLAKGMHFDWANITQGSNSPGRYRPKDEVETVPKASKRLCGCVQYLPECAKT